MAISPTETEQRSEVGVVTVGEAPAAKSPTRLAVERFRRDKLSMVSFIVVALLAIAAILAPLLVRLGVLDYSSLHQNLTDPANGGTPTGAHGGISSHHLLGVVPGSGWDVLSRLWVGVAFSIGICLCATIVSVVIGTVLGIIGGYSRGFADSFIGRIVDLTLSFPQTLMLLALSAPIITLFRNHLHLQGNLANALYVILVLGFFGWPSVQRLIRGQVLSIREREFIDAARSLGASNSRIYFRELLPNLWAPLLVVSTLMLPSYVSAEAALSYLGVGVQAPLPTLGNVLSDATQWIDGDPIYFWIPAVVIVVVVVSFNLLGDGLRDALDPKAGR
ncbi:ABC transporter permease [Nocardioides sp. BP30]|uniref:ABC transporter permease n=1 Tax=Nocardioides sp. BP30 TaxID=3036374 RepID=UPI002469A3FE|nr:ABC transporter permease [Nocardioides sp. BP30]WGL50424.1 ABC transporter permease [Nocardioides sp. BP30]